MIKRMNGITVLMFSMLFSISSIGQTKKEIDSLISAYISLDKFNGTILVTKKGKKIYENSYGYSNKNKNQFNSSKSIFPIGSITKPFTAVIILKLFEEHEISIDEPVSKFIDNYPRGEEITIKHLLTHSAGIYEPWRNPTYLEKIYSAHKFTNEEKMDFFKDYPLDFQPGSKFSYSNGGYDLLGVIIELVSGNTYQESLQKYILEPLKMTKTGVDYKTLKDSRKKVTGYSYLSKTKQIEAKLWNPDLILSSGALYSSTGDLLKFYKGLSSNKLISKQIFDEATTPYLEGYGYGWYIDSIGENTVINHAGNIEGFTSYFLMDPKNDISIILLNNITSRSLERIGNSVYKILTHMPYSVPKPKQEIQLMPEVLSLYTGKYENSDDYIARITIEDNTLFLQINNEAKLKLLAEKENVFFIKGEDIEVEFISKENNLFQIQIRQGLSRKVIDRIE